MASAAPPPAASVLDTCAAFMGTDVKSSGDMEKATWFIDSHVKRHMTGNQSLISNLMPVNNQVVPAGNGEGKQVHGIGSVNTEAVVLQNVWYVPGLTMNMVSVHQVATEHDLDIEISGSECHVKRTSDGFVVGTALKRSDNKYEVDFLRIEQN